MARTAPTPPDLPQWVSTQKRTRWQVLVIALLELAQAAVVLWLMAALTGESSTWPLAILVAAALLGCVGWGALSATAHHALTEVPTTGAATVSLRRLRTVNAVAVLRLLLPLLALLLMAVVQDTGPSGGIVGLTPSSCFFGVLLLVFARTERTHLTRLLPVRSSS